ncbi:MAG: hypothetical protein ACI9W7_001354, partial [Porticoccaceae bacterium]
DLFTSHTFGLTAICFIASPSFILKQHGVVRYSNTQINEI